jgi:8-oxo-dGTP diphosphatase
MSDSTGYRNPAPTVDIIIEWRQQGIVLIKRRNPPYGWALPGGFIDYGEPAELAALREAKEETTLDVELLEQLGVYSDPARDPRGHTMSVVFVASADTGTPTAEDDAAEIGVFPHDALPGELCFDHGQILADYSEYKRSGQRPKLTYQVGEAKPKSPL